MSIDKLMQPDAGEPHWTELAACQGDPRFTQQHPPEAKQAKQLSDVCRGCDVFFECLEFHDECAAIGVFAHGEWRSEEVK